ncbi:MAG: MFS transporter [Clostridiales bacterium]|nr:MFS transporter [Clostridiales bacterium]
MDTRMQMTAPENRKLTRYFCLLHVSYYCLMAVHTGFFSLMLSRQGLAYDAIARVATATSIASLFAPMVLGNLCDRWQLNRMLFVLAAVLAPISYYIIQRTQSTAGVTICAIVFCCVCVGVQSLPGGWISALNADRAKINYAFTRSFGSLSFALVSIVIGVAVEHFGMKCLPLLLAFFGMFIAIFALLLPNQPKPQSRSRDGAGFRAAMKALLKNRKFVALLLGSVLYNIPSGVFFTFFSVYFTQLGGAEGLLGIAMFVLAVVEVPVMLFYTRLEKKFGVTCLTAIAMCGFGVKNICLSMASSPGWAIVCLLLQMFGLGLSIPACQSFVAKNVPAEYSATAQAAAFSVGGLGMIAANALSSWLVTVTDLRTVFHLTAYFAFAGALIFIIGAGWRNTGRRGEHV